ncbi:radical SAM protein [Micromonospora fluostatini]|uniref:Radical SAM protein n=1 Tax=Micromonospora fluostatini TaxID=1629071 RepID=A0ABY2DI42_9ACTN|nr:radical SAM protein [Micromonospora fluostatini]
MPELLTIGGSRPEGSRDRTRVHYRRFHNIYLYITERCQLRCGHCYMGDRLERGLSLSYDKAVRIMNQCRTLGGEYITFLGGEPTLHPDLPRMVDHAREVGYRQVMINSNGLLERTIDKIAPEKLHYISFSLDGASAEVHDAVRGEGMFDKTVPCIRSTVEAGYPVRLICTISQINIADAPNILALADEIGVQMVNFHVFSEEGRGIANAETWSLSPYEWISFYEHLESIKDEYRTSIWYPPTYANRERLERYVDEGYRGCVGCSLDRLSIFPDGRSYVCSVLFDEPMHFAVMTDQGLRLNRQQNEFELFTQATFQAGDEPWLSGCPAEAVLARNGKPTTPPDLVSLCRLWKSQA